jgi:hypothetical protein
MGPNDKHDKPPTDPITFVDTVMDHVAQEEADNAPFTPEEDRWALGIRQNVDMHLAALRRQLTLDQPTSKRPISDEIRALDREGLLAQLEVLRRGPGARYAHLDLTRLTTDDLRQMLAEILEPSTEE